jgi:hypothetical protein
MTGEKRRGSGDEGAYRLSDRGHDGATRPGRTARSAFVPARRAVVVGVVVLLVALAGCGGDSGDGTRTPIGGTVEPRQDGVTTADGTALASETRTATTDPGTTTGRVSTTDDGLATPAGATRSTATIAGGANASTAAARSTIDPGPETSGLDVVVEPRTANTSDVELRIHAAMSADTATEGIENVTVDAGEGLDVSNVTVLDVATAGIDEGSDASGSRTDGPGLGSNVEGDIASADDGTGFVVPLDGNRSVDPTDEIVVVIDGGVATTAPGNYTFSLGIDDAPIQTDSYNVTRA